MNIGNALLYRLPQDLNLQGIQTNVALCVFFVGYIAFEIPANILIKRNRPHIFCVHICNVLVSGEALTILTSTSDQYRLQCSVSGSLRLYKALVNLTQPWEDEYENADLDECKILVAWSQHGS